MEPARVQQRQRTIITTELAARMAAGTERRALRVLAQSAADDGVGSEISGSDSGVGGGGGDVAGFAT